MKYYGKAEETARKILDLFKTGDVPKALAQIFLAFDDSPCRRWSWSNRLLVALNGHFDARGFRQWEEVGRNVRKGEKAFHILSPMKVPAETESGEPTSRLIGFRTTAVFGYDQTEGEELPNRQTNKVFLDALPFRNVAQSWGLSIQAFPTTEENACGWYSPSHSAIALGVSNLSTWAHELAHAAHDRLGLLDRTRLPDCEIVAELAGAVLLQCIGQDTAADLGGCWGYVTMYAKKIETEPLVACQRLLGEVCQTVALILDTANEITEAQKLAAEAEGMAA